MPTYRFASRLERLGTEGVFEVMALVKQLEREGRNIVHLEIGEPDFDTPAPIKRRAEQAMAANQTHYTGIPGLLELRESVARHVSRSRGVSVGADLVAISPGCKVMLFMVLSALIDQGDEVLVCTPGYPAYEASVRYLGGEVVHLPLEEDRDFRFDLDLLAARVTPRTRLLILNSPQNPTGGTLTASDCRRIAEIAEEKDFLILSDEIYSRILYQGEHASVFSYPGMIERTILVDGFSKSYAMTGWRLGYAVMPDPIGRRVAQLLTSSVSCVNTFVQWAGVEALEGPQDEVERMVLEFRRRRDVLVDGLNSLPGVTCRLPVGAFYAFPNIRQLGHSSQSVASYLLQEAGVACVPGNAYGALGEGYLRMSYATSVDNLQQAVERMRTALARMPAAVSR